ncbi:MAG: cell wall-associated hydrolase, invasion-associated protein [Chthonomonadaceae bacterium]|nr:cell wall-associated hydrolase, invasion-associated protein [Chthonomonadaceae bacterium]
MKSIRHHQYIGHSDQHLKQEICRRGQVELLHEPTPEPLPKPFLLWIAFNLLAVGFYLLPLSMPGERLGLLLGLAVCDRTRLTGTMSTLNRADYSGLQAGEIVVTQSGAHTMAYLGDRIWIEADPLAGSVITVQAPAAKNPWFEQSMKIMRWRDAE